MKKSEWRTFDKENVKLSGKLRRKMKPLLRLYEKYGLSYMNICILQSLDGTTSQTVRAKDSEDRYVVNSFAFER